MIFSIDVDKKENMLLPFCHEILGLKLHSHKEGG